MGEVCNGEAPNTHKPYPHKTAMTFILQNAFFVLGAIFFGVAVVFTVVMMRIKKRVDALWGDTASIANPDQLFAHLVRRIAQAELKIDDLNPRCAALEQCADLNIQKVGFLRFNPFQDTGGDNSFALALLDRKHNGVLISSLYSREGTRVYAKRIEHGKTRYPLLEEEKQALEEALQQ